MMNMFSVNSIIQSFEITISFGYKAKKEGTQIGFLLFYE